ncbi:hypothetical protein SAMN00017405_1167 [Desulfonispora thiosulfatigenes DSM 11270]|uniref:CAAX protease self-immunity n=1 Tax=Desulfonispora thiosulfatigenes DSM 11270 TaxID=656914 RepID=A0A1W1UZH0_DESTI|nr:hypothetical protein [Desulfonispora thiosulfatigenes]SMB86495.1 hypothetical protein SAMN00017405_1167 [Desulfonispora thiosulfatigenes DSM 11270]
MYLIAGLIAALLAWGANVVLLKKWGEAALLVLTPIQEEIFKTSLAIFFGGSIILTHVIFGIIEGIWDMKFNIKGLIPGILAVVIHSFFGFITWIVYIKWGNLSFAIMIAIIMHIMWNTQIVKINNN